MSEGFWEAFAKAEIKNNKTKTISEFVNDILNYLNSQFVDKKSIDYQYWERRKEIWEKIGK